MEYILKGALNESIDSCSTLIKSKLFSKSNCEMKECSFDNVYQPVMGNVFTEEDFYAFSFFYDRIYSLDQKSNFTVKRTRELADLVCKQKLDGFSFDTMEEVGNNLDW